MAEYSVIKDDATDGMYYVEDNRGVIYRNTRSITLSDAKDKAEMQGLKMKLSTFAGRLRTIERLDEKLYHVSGEALELLGEVFSLYLASQLVDEQTTEDAAIKLAKLLKAAIDSNFE